jgi:uncharacterized membrane protein
MARKPRKELPGPVEHHPWIVRFVHFHIRLVAAMVLGIAAYFLLPGNWPFITRLLVSWDIGVAIYVGAVIVMMLRAGDQGPQQRAATQEDEGATAILLLAAVAATASLGAIFAENRASQIRRPRLRLSCRTRGRHRSAVVGIHTYNLRATLCLRLLS